MDKIKVLITNNQDKGEVPSGTKLLVRRCCNAVLVKEEFKGPAEISVIFVDNESIRELNQRFRSKDIETDVLSFPTSAEGKYDVNPATNASVLGDIVISIPKAHEQARLYGHSFRREMAFLTVHSMFHLLGYDHDKGGIEAALMREREEEVLESLGVSRSDSYNRD